MSVKRVRWMVAAFLFFAVLITTVVDVFVFTKYGEHATISQILTDWYASDNPTALLATGFLFGMLTNHLLGWWMIPSKVRKQFLADTTHGSQSNKTPKG